MTDNCQRITDTWLTVTLLRDYYIKTRTNKLHKVFNQFYRIV